MTICGVIYYIGYSGAKFQANWKITTPGTEQDHAQVDAQMV